MENHPWQTAPRLLEDMTLTLDLRSFEGTMLAEHLELAHPDLKAANGPQGEPVAPRAAVGPAGPAGSGEPILLKKASWNVLRFKVKG